MKKHKSGFTIIEVVLVLAIAGLIFLMVFIALPALQRNQRNTQRKDDADRIAALIPSYQKNNGGKIPVNSEGFDTNFIVRYVDESCKNPMAISSDEAGGAGSGGYVFEGCESGFVDPDGGMYKIGVLRYGDDSSISFQNHKYNHVVYVGGSLKCGDTEGELIAAMPNDYVILMVLEGESIYCIDNS